VSIADVLSKAADLIEPEGAWTQHVDARDAAGNQIDHDDVDAVCWCADGAYMRVGGNWGDAGWRALQVALGGDGPISWNDAPERTQAEVVAKLREAAALAREQGL
jgi:hypothetical protein